MPARLADISHQFYLSSPLPDLALFCSGQWEEIGSVAQAWAPWACMGHILPNSPKCFRKGRCPRSAMVGKE